MRNSIIFKIVAALSATVLLSSCAAPIAESSAGTLPLSTLESTGNYQLSTADTTNSELSALLTTVNEEIDSSPNVTPGSKSEDDPSSSTPSSSSSSGSAMPAIDFAMQSGKKFTLKTNASTGATVTASVNGTSVKLKETKTKGVFNASYTMPNVSGVKDLGIVTYSISNNGKSAIVKSEGRLFAVGTDSTLHVQVKTTAATVFSNPKQRNSGFVTTVKMNAVDSVSEYYGNMYKLSTYGWVDASAVKPLTQQVTLNNAVSSTTISKTVVGDQLTLHGTSHPPYKATQTNDDLTLTFARTSGVPQINAEELSLFSSVNVVDNGGSTTITFTYKQSKALWGYMVEYGSGDIRITFRPRPTLSEGDRPLTGVTIAVDAGHGGEDKGTLGLGAGGNGVVEKEINLATATALKKSLEARGATVLMIRSGDSKVSLSDRLSMAEKNHVDFFISIHGNSAANKDASGTEVFYFNGISRSLATNISNQVSNNNGWKNRGAKHSCYVVTLNSFAPSVLVEVGFLTNTSDYKTMQSEAGINATVKGIVDSLIAELK